MAKAGKKQKLGGSSKDPKTAKPDKQCADISEAHTQDPEAPIDEPPPFVDATIPEQMDTELNRAARHDRPSPKSPTPQKPSLLRRTLMM